ncbi:META domain-containing protein [Glutamicibacter sp. JL.03c]|uniref:META domain-containing protein n=1 Tax=Glutamicibacter sp. JL.03c TaxID=2984842 RepID=UPI0021F741FC|nr:META domain-containing protein [Glutamicibacter sp. JL.03c]UYQ78737.1 META domain-containing protein [Glutamicibacter sp. JL.03c]
MKAGQLLGLWGSKDHGQPWLELLHDGRVLGHDGCNRLFGQWVEAADVEFRALGSTRMFCEGIDDWLSRAAIGKLHDDGSMAIFDREEKELGILAKEGKNS